MQIRAEIEPSNHSSGEHRRKNATDQFSIDIKDLPTLVCEGNCGCHVAK